MINSFRLGDSAIAPLAPHEDATTQGSKVLLVWDTSARWQADAPVVPNPALLKAIVSFPRPGQSNGSIDIFCREAVVTRLADRVEVLCQFDGDIHGSQADPPRVGDTATFEAPPGWLKNTSGQIDESEALTVQNTTGIANNSKVLYPQPIASWDDLPHRVYPSPTLPFPPTTFTIDLAIFHAYSYPGSPFGDLQVTVFLDSISPQQVIAVPTGKVSERPGFPRYVIYRATFTTTGLLDDANARVQCEIKPSRGDAASVLTSTPYNDGNTWNPGRSLADGGPGVQPNIEELRIVTKANLSALDLTPRYAVVDLADGDDAIRGVFLTKTDARLEANRFETVEGAKASAGSTGNPADIDNLQILMWGGKHRYGPTPISQTDHVPITVVNSRRPLVILPDDGVSRDQVEITNAAFALAFNIPQDTAFSLRNTSAEKTYDWRWTSNILRIRDVTPGPDFGMTFNFPRLIDGVGRTVAELVQEIDEREFLEVDAEILNNHGDWLIHREGGHFPGTSLPVEFGSGATVEASGNVDTSIKVNLGSMEISIGSETLSYPFDENTTTVQELVDQIIADWQTERGLLFASEVIRDISTEILAVLTPQIIDSGQKVTLFENQHPNGIQHAYVELRNITLRTIGLKSAAAAGIPGHLFMDQVKCRQETRATTFNAGSIVPARAGDWLGGIWSRRGDWDTVNQCTSGWVMVRDAFFKLIGADVGREISYACNWVGEDIELVPGDDRHGDIFQWFPGVGVLVHGNIIAVNFDMRTRVDAQPFLLNPRPGTPGHTYRGVAFINWRINTASTHQIAGNGDHILFRFCDILQGQGSAAISLEAVAAGQKFHNVRIINTVCERLSLGAGEFPADMPSLWSILHNDHIIDRLDDENGPVSDITAYPGCTTGSDLQTLFQDFVNGDWHPKSPGPLVNRTLPVAVVYRYDAEGGDRTTILQPPIGALLV